MQGWLLLLRRTFDFFPTVYSAMPSEKLQDFFLFSLKTNASCSFLLFGSRNFGTYKSLFEKCLSHFLTRKLQLTINPFPAVGQDVIHDSNSWYGDPPHSESVHLDIKGSFQKFSILTLSPHYQLLHVLPFLENKKILPTNSILKDLSWKTKPRVFWGTKGDVLRFLLCMGPENS